MADPTLHTVLLLERPWDTPAPAGALVLRPTREQRTGAPCPAGEIRSVPGAGASRLPGTADPRCTAATYRAVTERLTREAEQPAGRRAFFLSFVNGFPGHEEDYDRWYLQHHVHEVLAAPDFVAAQRFTLVDQLRQDLVPVCRYLAIYELRTESLAGSIAALERRLMAGTMTPTPYKDPSRRLQLFAADASSTVRGGCP